MPLSSPRRRGARRGTIRLLVLVVLLSVWFTSLGIAYRAGRTEQALHATRLEADLAAQAHLVQDLSRRAAEAQQRSAAAEQASAAARAQTVAAVAAASSDEVGELVSLLRRRVGEGVPVARLRDAVETAADGRRCDPTPETGEAEVAVRSGRDAKPLQLAEGLLTVRLRGIAARSATGKARAWFDPAQPVEVAYRLAGEDGIAKGVLPWRETRLQGDTLYRLEVLPHERRERAAVLLTVCRPI